jgi:hypothetical protein
MMGEWMMHSGVNPISRIDPSGRSISVLDSYPRIE